MTRTTEREVSSHTRSKSSKRNHRNAQILDGHLHLHQPSMDPPKHPSNTTSSSSPKVIEPTPNAGKFQIKAEKLVWKIEKKLRISSSSSPGDDDFIGNERLLNDKNPDSQTHASQDQKYMMSGALPADDDRCELGDACYREDRGRETTMDESKMGDVRGWVIGWQIPSSKISWEERERERERKSSVRRV